MNELLISIIVPIYNIDNYVSKCIESILSQTHSNIEVILIDDGSTDKSSNICDYYSKKDARIVAIHKKNGGLSSARNTGLDIAKGKYIGFVDGDDYIEPNMYEELLNNIHEHQSDIAICNYNDIKNNKKYTNYFDNELEKTPIEGKNKFDILYKNYNFVICSWNKLYKKEIFNNLRFPENKIFEE